MKASKIPMETVKTVNSSFYITPQKMAPRKVDDI